MDQPTRIATVTAAMEEITTIFHRAWGDDYRYREDAARIVRMVNRNQWQSAERVANAMARSLYAKSRAGQVVAGALDAIREVTAPQHAEFAARWTASMADWDAVYGG